jgi:hypothetical protein
MKGKKSMLDYCKQILKAVHFDRNLFKKEYRKSLKWLPQPEVVELKNWIRAEF